MATPQKIADGLYQITRGANIFILEDNATLTIIDAGFPGATQQLLRALEQLGHQPSAVKHILVTHADIDHVGSLAGFAQATGAQVYAGMESKPHIEDVTSPEHLPKFALPFFTPIQKLVQKPATVDYVFHDNEVLDIAGGLRVLHCPGHTPDNYCFYWDAQNVLFAPDLLNRMNGQLIMTQPTISWDSDAAKASVQRVLALAPSIICVGHGAALSGAALQHEVGALRAQLA